MNTIAAMSKPIKKIVLLLIMLTLVPEVTSGATTDDGYSSSSEEPSNEVRFSADEMNYDRELGITTARGNVQFTNQDRIQVSGLRPKRGPLESSIHAALRARQ